MSDTTCSSCRRPWLVTTNDNIDALRFYPRCGFALVAVHARAVARRPHPLFVVPNPSPANARVRLRDYITWYDRAARCCGE